jgi:DNA-directed RNA polymerase specialized sigma24 family protein
MNHGTDPQLDLRFTTIYTEQADRVRRVIAAELRAADHAEADDLTQDVFLTLWQYLLRGEAIARPAGLLTTMARHRVCDHYRSARVRREVSVDAAQAHVLPAASPAEDIAVERVTAVAMLADYPAPLGVGLAVVVPARAEAIREQVAV